ncbi:MAG: hypothetical protein Fur0041_12310 [Bacteroidia bacterium]
MTRTDNILRTATFDPNVKTYIFIVVLFYLFITVVGWILIPFWLFGGGQWLSGKFFKTLKCELSEKNLRFSKGMILHIEKTIPLENIQDLSFIGGPILRAFGLTMIKVETAGGGGPHGNNMMSMIGIENAEEFKTMILDQREKIIAEKYSFTKQESGAVADQQIFTDIRNELRMIRELLSKK